MTVDASWLIPFLAALAAGAVSGVTGFGGGTVLALLLASGASLLDSLASVKILAAACDAATLAGLAHSGRITDDTVNPGPVLACAVGAALTAGVMAAADMAQPLAGIAIVALAAGVVLRHRSSANNRAVARASGFGAYLAVWGFAGGSLWTAWRTLGGRSVRTALVEARALGAAGNTVAALVYVCVLPVAWATIVPVFAGHLAGAYGASRWLASRGTTSSRSAGVSLSKTPAAVQSQSVPSRCISEQVSQRLPPRPSTCE